jgi:hypothetical protein
MCYLWRVVVLLFATCGVSLLIMVSFPFSQSHVVASCDWTTARHAQDSHQTPPTSSHRSLASKVLSTGTTALWWIQGTGSSIQEKETCHCTNHSLCESMWIGMEKGAISALPRGRWNKLNTWIRSDFFVTDGRSDRLCFCFLRGWSDQSTHALYIIERYDTIRPVLNHPIRCYATSFLFSIGQLRFAVRRLPLSDFFLFPLSSSCRNGVENLNNEYFAINLA